MSTEGLTGIDALQKALADTASDVRATAQTTSAKANEIRTQAQIDADNVAIAARRIEQEHRDQLEALDHQAGQQAYILTGNRPGAAPAPSDPPADNPSTSGNDNPAEHDNPATRHDNPPVPADDQFRNFRPANWGPLAWILAVIGAIIGFVIARYTYSPLFQDYNHMWLYNWAVTIWYILLIASGFFTGGWAGATFAERRADRNRNNPGQ